MVSIQEVEALKKSLDNVKARAMRINAERSAVIKRAQEICAKYGVKKVEELETIRNDYANQLQEVLKEVTEYLNTTGQQLQEVESTLTE